jgi:hypothetical protein
MRKSFLSVLLCLFSATTTASAAETQRYLTAGAAYSHWKFHYDDVVGAIFNSKYDVSGALHVAGPALGFLSLQEQGLGFEGHVRVLRAFRQEFHPVADWRHRWFVGGAGNINYTFGRGIFAFTGLNLLTSVGSKKYEARHFGVGYQAGVGWVYNRLFFKAYYEKNGNLSLFSDGSSFRGFGLGTGYLFAL